MDYSWNLMVNLGIISIALVCATALRTRVTFLQRFLIPNALAGGAALLLFYNYIGGPVLGLDTGILGDLIFHLLNISFIAMSLRPPSGQPQTGRPVAGMANALLTQYALQTFVGFALTFVLIFTILPDLFPGFGLLLTMGFALGPAQAFTLASTWEKSFPGAGTVGLTFGAVGYLWACFGGFLLITQGVRRGWVSLAHTKGRDLLELKGGVLAREDQGPPGAELRTESEAIDSMSLHFGLILGIYLLTYLGMHLLTWLLSFLGKSGNDLASSFWGITFIFAAIAAIGARILMARMKLDHVLDHGTLNRVGGTSVDYMVAAALGAISLSVVAEYWLPILIISTVGGAITLTVVPFICSRMFDSHQFHRTLLIYGATTGTLPTGLMLLRVIDPEFETPALSDYIPGSAIVFALCIPLILTIRLPLKGYVEGDPMYHWIAFAVFGLYVIGTAVAFRWIAGKRAFQLQGSVWYRG